MKNMLFYSNFRASFLEFYESEEYDKMLLLSDEFNKRMQNREYFDVHRNKLRVLSYEEKINILQYFLRKEKNEFNKTIATIDTLMPSNTFSTILYNHNIDTDKFVKMFNRFYLMSNAHKACDDGNEIQEILMKLKKFFGIKNTSLCVYKIYEIQALNELEKEKTLS